MRILEALAKKIAALCKLAVLKSEPSQTELGWRVIGSALHQCLKMQFRLLLSPTLQQKLAQPKPRHVRLIWGQFDRPTQFHQSSIGRGIHQEERMEVRPARLLRRKHFACSNPERASSINS